MKIKYLCCYLTFSLAAIFQTSACDLCGCYTPQLETQPINGSEATAGLPSGMGMRLPTDHFYAGVGEQFTYFGTVQVNGREVANPSGQFEDSSITQLVAGYIFDSHFALQLNVPLIYRYFERPEGFHIDKGTEAGLGDVSLLLRSVLYHYQSAPQKELRFDKNSTPAFQAREPDFTASVVLLTGVKFPTGDSSRLEEEFHEVDIPGAPVSGIHGHDLTLGTGSYDGIFGGEVSLRYKNLFFENDAQFTLRGDGTHQYHFANDLSWSGGPGYYFIRRPNLVCGVQFVVSGEHKDVDRFEGKPADDTGISSVFVGPRFLASFGRCSCEVGTDLPVLIDNTALQVVPDYRVRAGFAVHF